MGCHAIFLHNLLPHTPSGDRASAAIGGGYYPRSMPVARGTRLYRVRKLCAAGEFATITQALAQWNADKQAIAGHRAAMIEIADSGTYHEAPRLALLPGERLVLRAADMTRPVLRMFEYHSGAHERIAVEGGAGSRLTMEGLLVAGGPLVLAGDQHGAPCQVALRHCTLVPGWDTEPLRGARWGGRPSVICDSASVALRIDHSIVGPLQCGGAGGSLRLVDSIVDGGHAGALALADQHHGAAMLAATILRTTIIGLAQLDALVLAENALFLGPLLVGCRSQGKLRHCYLAAGSLTPAREHCQPARPDAASWGERQRLQPRFRSLRYGDQDYGKLAPECAWEVACGADDGAEMGAYHDLHRSSLMLARAVPVRRQGRGLAPLGMRESDRRECVA